MVRVLAVIIKVVVVVMDVMMVVVMVVVAMTVEVAATVAKVFKLTATIVLNNEGRIGSTVTPSGRAVA